MAKKKPDVPASGLIDLDTVVIGTIPVRLKGIEYLLPDQVPLNVALKLMNTFDKMQGDDDDKVAVDPGLLEEMFTNISQIFVFAGYEEMVPAKLNSLMTLQQGAKLLRDLMGRLLAQQEEAGNP